MVGKVKVVGFDEDLVTLQAVADGQIEGTVVQDPYNYGYKSVEVLAAIARGDESKAQGVEKAKSQPYQVITKDGGPGAGHQRADDQVSRRPRTMCKPSAVSSTRSRPSDHPPPRREPASASSSPGVLALDGVSVVVHPGEVLAVVGENGAGKSTLMKVLAGVYKPDAGVVELDGRAVHITGPAEANAAGVVLIHQELNLADNLSGRRQPVPRPRADHRRVPPRVEPPGDGRAVGGAAGEGGLADRPHPSPRRRPAARGETTRRNRAGTRHRRPGAHHGRADLQPHPARDRNTLHGDRRVEGGRRVGRVHLAPAGRGEALCRPRDGTPRRPQCRRVAAGADHARQHGPADGRPGPEAVLPEGPPDRGRR